MKENPYSDRYEQACEHLRLALSLLSEHRLSPSPLNYRIGYDIVAGNDSALKTAFEDKAGGADELTDETLWSLYREAYVEDEDVLETMRKALQEIITTLQQDFERSGTSLSGYVRTLDRFSTLLDEPVSPKAMAAEVNKVLGDTRATRQGQSQLRHELSHISSEVESLRRELEQVKEESMTDGLTGIANRKAFDAVLEHTIHTARETGMDFCVVLIDIDHFKLVNDTYGHLIGDKVLRFTATTLKRLVRGKDTVARFGGEEFALILPDTDMDGATTVAEHIRQTVSAGDLKDRNGGSSYGRITVSIGIAAFTPSDLPNKLIDRADRALYLAKEHGRNRVENAA
jgi:diguanylate cyclase